MTAEVQERLEVDGGEQTAFGFGGVKINRRLEIGDEIYLVLRCEVSSDGREEKKDGNLGYKAGCRTTVLAELTASEATKVADEYRKTSNG